MNEKIINKNIINRNEIFVIEPGDTLMVGSYNNNYKKICATEKYLNILNYADYSTLYFTHISYYRAKVLLTEKAYIKDNDNFAIEVCCEV